MKQLPTAFTKGLITTLIFFTCAEVALRGIYGARSALVRFVPLPYAFGDEYGPLPPWLDWLLMLVPDNTLIWRSLPNVHRTYVDIFTPVHTEQARLALLRRFSPTLPPEFRANPTWRVDLSSQGLRTAEYAVTKRTGSIRIACIGDSWTFGMNVDQDQTYPSRLFARLREAHPDADVEVLNFGVLGYSSFQGLQLLKTRVLALAPDVLAIGFAMNDSEVAGYRDKDMVTPRRRPRAAAMLAEAARGLESYKLLQYLALATRFHPKPVGEYIREEAGSKSGPIDYDAIEPWTRVSPRDYEANIREMIRLQAAHGGRAVLIDNELWEESPYRPILRTIAADTDVPLVDSLHIVANGKAAVERELETRLGLASHSQATAVPAFDRGQSSAGGPGQTVRVVFRVFRGSIPVPTAISIVGTEPQLGSLVPNGIQMHDDGRDGDERASDGVWSYATSLPAGAPVFYIYTNSGRRGRWEGLDVPSIRHVTIPAGSAGASVYLPIETFGQIYMQADNWHTNAAGYDLIAAAVAGAVRPALHSAQAASEKLRTSPGTPSKF